MAVKSANIYDIVKPLPGDFTPMWECAVEKQEKGVTKTSVPIDANIKYLAVYPCNNNGNEQSEHLHDVIAVVQKMLVVITSDSSTCYIVNIVPYENCILTKDEIEKYFVCYSNLRGFSGFAAYHNFDGSLVFIDQYEDGIKNDNACSKDRAKVSAITRGVKLYNNPDFINYHNALTTKADPMMLMPVLPAAKCYCGNIICKHPNQLYYHCVNCQKELSICLCYTYEKPCPYCGLSKTTDIESRKCHCPDCKAFHNYPKCITCGALNCYKSHKNNSSLPYCLACGGSSCPIRLSTNGKHVVHADIIRTIFKSVLSFDNLHSFQEGCNSVGVNFNTEQYQYMHAVTDKFYEADVKVDYDKLKNHFISYVKSFKASSSYCDLGKAFHPLFDSYLTIPERVEFSFNYYSYDKPNAIINEQHLQSYMTASIYCVTNMLKLHNTIINLPSNTSNEQLDSLLEAWIYSHSEEIKIQ